jgi:predicted RNase H-like HicB family nuclease
MLLPDFYRYIAIFTFADDGVHIVFPDLPGCVSFGKDEDEAVNMAKDVLKLHMYGMEQDGDEIPDASKIKEIAKEEALESNEAFVVVEVFMPPFREKQSKRFVKKTLSIPYWLNAEAEMYGINFSQTLQNAIKKQLNISN